jgi:integrase
MFQRVESIEEETMLLVDAVHIYVTDREARKEIKATSTPQLRWRLARLVVACDPDMTVAGLNRAAILEWQRTISAHKPATRRSELSTVRTFCRWCIGEGLLGSDPTVGVARIAEERREDRALTPGQVARLLLVLPDWRARVIVSLMLRCGLRCCEVANLAVRDYNPEAATILVKGKAGHERRLPVPGLTGELLDVWLANRPAAGPLVGLTAARISVLVSGWMAAAGLKSDAYDGVSAHALRHTFASDLLDRCGNVRVVQAALGHQSLATTQRYVRTASMDQLRQAMDPDWTPAA